MQYFRLYYSCGVCIFFSSLAFYDCSANSFDKQFVICSLDYCVLTMDYW